MTTSDDPTIGLLGGLGVGAAIHYYRELAAAHDDHRQPMKLVMIHASISRATEHASKGDRLGLASYLAGLLARLQSAGATIGVLPAVTPHMCIDELTAITPLPLIDLTHAVADHIQQRGLSRVALFGTRFVVESDMSGQPSRGRDRAAAGFRRSPSSTTRIQRWPTVALPPTNAVKRSWRSRIRCNGATASRRSCWRAPISP